MRIGFIGAGVMGLSMIEHLAKKHEVHVYTRTLSKVAHLNDVHTHTSIASCVQGCDTIISMVGYPNDVEDIYFSDNGILKHCDSNATLIDMTTSSPSLAQKIAKSTPCSVLDAPVSGGDKGAKNATLSIMVGGDEEVFKKSLAIFSLLGSTITYVGEHGSGQHCKMCNQIAVAGSTVAYSEALVYAKTYNLDIQKVLSAISSGAAQSWQIDNMAPRVVAKDFEPGFFIKHFIKDMKIASEAMKEKGISLEALNCVLAMYEQIENKEEGTQALIKYYEK